MFPVDAQSTAREPASAAFATATTMPRSLNDPVGLHISSFSQTSAAPVRSASRSERTSGVPPSPSVISGVASVSGSHSA